ncbi:hypothetical protein KCP77_21095 [Salmonella enterica subsp. enterica]|nr:hypothetical protein KCP77_21095 [Salmonella enterica subsp. enterica]
MDTLEKHHNVLILDEAVRAAVQLFSLYSRRQLPDKLPPRPVADAAHAACQRTVPAPAAKAAEMERSLLQKQENGDSVQMSGAMC